jgi:prophage regulatory protein
MKEYIQDKILADRYGVNRSTVWTWVRKGIFPEPVKLTPGCTRWRWEDVARWESQRPVESQLHDQPDTVGQ